MKIIAGIIVAVVWFIFYVHSEEILEFIIGKNFRTKHKQLFRGIWPIFIMAVGVGLALLVFNVILPKILNLINH